MESEDANGGGLARGRGGKVSAAAAACEFGFAQSECSREFALGESEFFTVFVNFVTLCLAC